VAGGTSEIRLFKIEQHSKSTTQNLNKVITLTQHKSPVIDISFWQSNCATIGQDGQVSLYKIDLAINSYSVQGIHQTDQLDDKS